MRSMGRVVAISTLVLSAGCASYAGTGGYYSRGETLRAMLLPQMGGAYGEVLRFQVSKPAHVAVFRIIPGYGSTLLYPRPGYGSMDGMVYSGIHRVADAPWLSSFAAYDAPLQMNRARRGLIEPEFYLLVASERPLRLSGLGMYGMAGSAASYRYNSASGFATMDMLVSEVVPDPMARDWTTDYYVHWPEAIYTDPRAGLIELRCARFRVWVSPENYEKAAQTLCGDGRQDQNPPGGELPGDSTEIIEPNRRAPVPAAERIASSQLQATERWEEARRGALEGRPIDLEANPARANATRARRGVSGSDDPFSDTGRRNRPGMNDDRPSGRGSPSPSFEPRTRPEPRADPEPRTRPEPRADPEPVSRPSRGGGSGSDDSGGGGRGAAPRTRPTL